LNYFRDPQEWNIGLPAEKLFPEMREILQPYDFRREKVNDVYQYYESSALPNFVRKIALDEWSFVKENSSVLIVFNQLASFLHQWGIVIVDATNQAVDLKAQLLHPFHGVRVILGIAVSIAALRKAKQGATVAATAWGGVALALFDL